MTRSPVNSIFQWARITGFFYTGSARSINAKRNIFQSLILKGISIAISLAMVPLTINYVNPTRYGIWITLSSIIGWFSFFDIGLGNGLRNKFAEALAKKEENLARAYVSTTYAIVAIIIGVVLILFFIVNPFLDWTKILNTQSEMATELSKLALIVFTFFCIQFILQLLTVVLTAHQKPAKASFLNLLGSIVSLVIIFILTKTTTGSLLYLGITFSAAPVAVMLFSSLWLYRKEYKRFAPSINYVNFNHLSELMNLGVKFFVLQLAGIILFQLSNVIITQFFGPEQVTPYNIAFKYFSVITMVFAIIMTPFWSAFTEAWVSEDRAWIRRTVSKLRRLWVAFLVVTLIMLLSSGFIYHAWVGNAVKVDPLISIAMAVYVILTAFGSIYVFFLNGTGKVKLQLISSVIGTILFVPLAIGLCQYLKMGVAGILVATILCNFYGPVLAPIQYRKLMNSTAKGVWDQ